MKRRTQIAFHSFNMRMNKKKEKELQKNKRNTLSTTERSLCMISPTIRKSKRKKNEKKITEALMAAYSYENSNFCFHLATIFYGRTNHFLTFFSYFLFSHYSMTNTLYRMYNLIPRMPHFIHEQTLRYLNVYVRYC